MKILSEIHSGDVNNDSGLGALFIHFTPESLIHISRNLYPQFPGTIIHMPRNTQENLAYLGHLNTASTVYCPIGSS
jgi:hypothetical protein